METQVNPTNFANGCRTVTLIVTLISVGVLLRNEPLGLFVVALVLWLLLPHVVLFFASMIPKSEGTRALFALFALGVAALGLSVYCLAAFVFKSSTAPLYILWIPFWQLLVAGLTRLLAGFLGTRLENT